MPRTLRALSCLRLLPLFATALVCPQASADSAQPPNVVFILTVASDFRFA